MTKEEIGAVLKELRISNSKTQKEVAELLGRKQQVIGHWETGYSQPDADTLFRLCEIYKTTVDTAFGFNKKCDLDLDADEINLLKHYRALDIYGKNVATVVINEELKRLVDIRSNLVDFGELVRKSKENNYKKRMKVAGKISAGIGVEAIEDYEEIFGPDIADFALIVDGDSMEPTFSNGQVIYIKKTSAIEHGQVMAVQVMEEGDFFHQAYLKVVKYTDAEYNKIKLISLNDNYEDKIVDAKFVSVIGLVVE